MIPETAQGAPAIEVKDVLLGYAQGSYVVEIPTLNVLHGEVVGISGRNASGKSTLLSGIVGMVPYRRGTIIINGLDMSRSRTEQIAKSVRISYLLQQRRCFPTMTVRENLSMAIANPAKPASIEAQLEEPMYKSLADKLTQRASSLSGGEALLLGIACIDAYDADILLLDEPTAGADESRRAAICEKLLEWRKASKTILLVEHDTSVLSSVCSKLCQIDDERRLRLVPALRTQTSEPARQTEPRHMGPRFEAMHRPSDNT